MRHSKNNKGKTKCRTEYNSQLAAFRFPYLYELYKNDIHVSFAFTDNPNQEVDETVALNNFIQLENKRIKKET
jgi:hypothetical protein